MSLWGFDEHRVGLVPVRRRFWSPIGTRPRCLVRPKYQWVYAYGFVRPATGENEYWVLNRVDHQCLSEVLAQFARQQGAGPDHQLVVVLDRAGWHTTSKLDVPAGVHLMFQPPYSPELQPAERLWRWMDEPLVGRVFDGLEQMIECLEQRCCQMTQALDHIRDLTLFHWWPKPRALMLPS